MRIGFGLGLTDFGAKGGVADTPDLGSVSSLAMALLDGSNGLALDFTDDTWFTDTGFYGSAAIVGGGTQDGYDTSPDTAAASLLTYTSPSPKMTMGPSGALRFGAHNLYLNSAAPANQSITVVSGATYAVTLTGSVSVTASGAATGTWTAGTQTFTAATATLTFGSTSGSGTVHVRRTPSDDTYLATTSAARYALPYEWDTAGVLQGIRVEEARTNTCFPSQSLQAASWSAVAGSIAASAETAPDGTLTATRYTASVGSARNIIFRQVTITASTNQVHSYFVKPGTGNFVCLTLNSGSGNNHVVAIFDLSNSANTTATQTAVGSGGGTLVSTFQQAFPNGWFRVGLIGHTNTATPFTEIGFAAAATGNTIAINGDVSDAANGQTFHIWGVQSELGSFPTSHIQCPGASTVTRAADNISLATSAFPWSDGTFTVYIKGASSSVSGLGYFWEIFKDSPNRVQVYRSGTSSVMSNVIGGAQDVNSTIATVSVGTEYRIATAVQANNFASSQNGAAVVTDTVAALSTGYTSVTLARQQATSFETMLIQAFMIRPTRMTNAELQQLTSA